MNYYYDIILNWKENKPYEFYEWNDSDYLEMVKKIPLIKVKPKVFLDIVGNNIKVEAEFLETLKDKTLVSMKNSFKRIEYACLFTDTKNVMAIEFDRTGKSISRSKLLIDDELNILEVIYGMKEANFNYEVISKIPTDETLRQIKEAKKLILVEMHNLYEAQEINKLKYLYYEYKKENIYDLDYIYKTIIDDINT